jgi:phosphotransferase system HPr (HPr) family protein
MERAKARGQDAKGLHLRNSANVVLCARQFKSQVVLCHGCKEADACSILQILTLGAGFGEDVEIVANGPDEKEAVSRIVEVFGDGAGI